MAALIH